MDINGTIIKRISGPVNFKLLEPNMDFFIENNNEGIHIPIVILFGDRHESAEFMCNNCVCDDPHKNDCCYKINDDKFLKLLDSLSTEDKPVDFYIEWFFESDRKKDLQKEI